MNHFERMAIFTAIENLEAQLKGLKTLIAASNSPAEKSHKTTPILETDSLELSDEDEDKLQKELEASRLAQIEKMRKAAEAHFQDEWSLTANTMASLDG